MFLFKCWKAEIGLHILEANIALEAVEVAEENFDTEVDFDLFRPLEWREPGRKSPAFVVDFLRMNFLVKLNDF